MRCFLDTYDHFLMASFAECILYLHMRIFFVQVEVFESQSLSGIFLHLNGEFTRASGLKTIQRETEFGFVSIHAWQTVWSLAALFETRCCIEDPLKTVIENIDFINSKYLLTVVALTLANSVKIPHTYTHTPSLRVAALPPLFPFFPLSGGGGVKLNVG